jgi:hypothetical protein
VSVIDIEFQSFEAQFLADQRKIGGKLRLFQAVEAGKLNAAPVPERRHVLGA